MQLTDYYVATVAVILLALIVAFSTGVLYGAGRLARNIREMTAHSPSPLLIVCWAGVTPMLILVSIRRPFKWKKKCQQKFLFFYQGVCIFHLIDLEGLVYDHGTYVFPEWTAVLGWSVLAFILVPVPLFSILAIYQASGKTIIQVTRSSIKVTISFSFPTWHGHFSFCRKSPTQRNLWWPNVLVAVVVFMD